MFEFTHPIFLLLIPLVPLLAWRWVVRRKQVIRYSGTANFARLPPGRSQLARWTGVGLRVAVLVLLIVALAGLRRPDLRTRIATEGIAIEMVLDVSGSMGERDFDWEGKKISRLDAVKKAFNFFVIGGDLDQTDFRGRPNDLIGLVTFATWPESPCPLTLSHSVLIRLLEKMEPRTIPTESRTNIGDAIGWGLNRMESVGSGRKVMILLSDGEHNVTPPALTPRQGAQLAANQGVVIYAIDARTDLDFEETLAAGTEKSDRVKNRQDGQSALQAVAEITSGRYFRARDTASLMVVCSEIDRLERKPIESFIYRRYYPVYTWVGLAAFTLLTAMSILENTLWRRLP